MGSFPWLQRGKTKLAGDDAYLASGEPAPWEVVSQIATYDQYVLWRQIVHCVYIRLYLQTCHEAQPPWNEMVHLFSRGDRGNDTHCMKCPFAIKFEKL